jgi:hypothetical protein
MQLVSRNTRYENREEAWPCGDRTSDLLHRQLPTGANQRPHCASTAQTVQTVQTRQTRQTELHDVICSPSFLSPSPAVLGPGLSLLSLNCPIKPRLAILLKNCVQFSF